jgi:hypothetical protein
MKRSENRGNARKDERGVLIGALLVSILIVGYTGFSVAGNGNKGWVEPPKVVQASRQIMTDEGKSGKVQCEYPRISGVPDYVNDTLRGYIRAEINDFRRQSREAEVGRRRTEHPDTIAGKSEVAGDSALDLSRYSLYVTYDQAEIDSLFISLIFQSDAYVGGAHGVKKLHPFNFDLKKYEGVRLADLFPRDSSYLPRLSDYCLADLRAQLRIRDSTLVVDDKWLLEGTAASPENYRNFTFTRDSLIIYFEHYQVAPYYFGMFKVEAPRDLQSRK